MQNQGEPKVGDILDSRYRITGLLGTGGMGSVYRAEHVTIRRQVAIKVLHPSFAEDPDYAKRFEREAFVSGRTDHPNCVTVSDFGPLDGGGFYLVMELVDGVLLADLLDQVERLPARRALHIVRHVLRGLGHAHKHGIVHRDVKPANVILFEQDGDPDFAKILDFGIAKLVDAAAASDPANNQLTRIGTTVGTPTYVAPEQAVGGEVDARSDLYSVSVMLYEMLAGVPPFQDEDTIKVLAKHLSAPVPPIAERAPHVAVSPAVEALVRRGLAKDRKDRWASAEEMIAAIDDLFARGLVEPPAAAAQAPAVAPGAAAGGRLATPVPVATPPSGPALVPDPMLASAASGPVAVAPMPSGQVAAAAPLDPHTGTARAVRPARRFSRRQLALIGAAAALAIVMIALAAGGGGGSASPATPALVPPAVQAAAKAEEKAKKPDPRRQKALRQADSLVDRKRPRQALSLLDRELGEEAESDAQAQLLYGRAFIAYGRPIAGLKAYWRVSELDPELARKSEVLRKDVDSLVTRGSAEASLAAVELLAAIDDEPAREMIAKAAVDRRNAVRYRARELAETGGFGDKVDRLTSYVLDLMHGKTCEERARAVPFLRALGDKRAIPALQRARRRRTGGILGIGSRAANACMKKELEEAIAHLEKS